MRRGRALKIIAVACLLIGALAIRLVNEELTHYRPRADAGSYMVLASQIAHTGDYANRYWPGSGAGGSRGPTAYFPPGFPYFLAAVDLIGGHTEKKGPPMHGARISQALLGTVTVALVGVVAWEAFGTAVALAALALAAFYPVLVELSGILVAENLLTALVLAAVAAALRIRTARHPYVWTAAAGVLVGLATLSHVNGLLVVPPLAFAAAAAGRAGQDRIDRRGRWRVLLGAALLVATAALTIAPWTIRNAVVLHSFIPVSDETGITLVGTYNPASAANRVVPYKWRIYYGIPGERPLIRESGRLTEPQLSSRLEDQALDYIGTHPLAPLSVAFHNTLRMFELEGSFAWHASANAMGLTTRAAGIGVVSFWVVCLLAIGGVFTPAARRAPRWLWAVPLLLALSVVLVNVETPRFRAPVDPFLILLAACALATAAQRLVPTLRRAPVRGDSGAPAAPGGGEHVEVIQRPA
jgi:4-amino-4-deoxy-L-arabinose transferase-like glycosyltransferase